MRLIPQGDAGKGGAGVPVVFAAALVAAFVLLLLSYLASSYIVSGLAYSRLAWARGNERPWLAWIPIASSYLIGRISDDISAQYHKPTRRRILLPIFQAVRLATWFAYLIFYFFFSATSILSIHETGGLFPWYSHMLGSTPYLLALVFFFISTAASVCHMVFLFLSWNCVFREYAPWKAGNYIILSVLFYLLLSAPTAGPAVILIIYGHTPQFELLNQPRCNPSPNGNFPQQ